MIESDDKLYSLGIAPTNYEYLKYDKTMDEEVDGLVNGVMYESMITLQSDAVDEVRSIYTIWDALGEIGGLIDMLRLLG